MSDYSFVTADADTIVTELINAYAEIAGKEPDAASPERLFISWVADMLVRTAVKTNYAGNQNIPSRAQGDNLDALGEWIFGVKRTPAQAAKCTVRFTIGSAQSTAIAIPAGTRVTDAAQTLFWDTTADAVIAIGDTYADIMVQCETAGTVGNSYAVGQINKLVDVDNILYFSSCANTTESDGGTEIETDSDYAGRMRASMDRYSTAGARGAYIYHAMAVSDEIADVKAVRPVETKTRTLTIYSVDSSMKLLFLGGDGIDGDSITIYANGNEISSDNFDVVETDGLKTIRVVASAIPSSVHEAVVQFNQDSAGRVALYALMDDGTIATSTIKDAILAACSADTVRPMTDRVTVEDPAVSSYNVNIQYYIDTNTSTSLTDIQSAVSAAVDEYVAWQSAKLGRDINPAKLFLLLMQTGVKRVVISAPTFTVLSDGSDGSAPQVAQLGTKTIVNGGYEDE